MNEKVHITSEVERRAALEGDVFDDVPPPFALVSDMLLVGATCPVGPLRESFPGVPFVSIAQRAVLGIWFARVLGARVGPGGQRQLGPEQDPANFPYEELNVAVLLRGGRVFVPGIYATRDLTLRIGRRYGMPKRRRPMTYAVAGRTVRSRAGVGEAESHVVAYALTSSPLLGRWLDRFLPRWSPLATFPGGARVRARLERADGARLTWIASGRLALDEPWLPRPASLRGLALHLPRLGMVLPAPGDEHVDATP